MVTQDQVDGYGERTLTCTSGEVELHRLRVTLVLQAGEQVTCTFVITSTSLVINHDSAPNDPQDFSYEVCLDPDHCQTLTVDDDGSSDTTLSSQAALRALAEGTYTITQGAVGRWGLATLSCTSGEVDLAHRRATIELTRGEQATCTFVTQQTALIIVQDTSPNAAQDFGFDVCGGPDPCVHRDLDDDSNSTLSRTTTVGPLEPGSYTVTQAVVAAYGLTGLTCTGGETDLANRRATVELDLGEQVTCTFVDKSTTLTIQLDTSPNDAQDFLFNGCGPISCQSFSLDDDSNATLPSSLVFPDLAAGTYDITQVTFPTGWSFTRLTCTSTEGIDLVNRRVFVNLSPGEQTTCTFTNSLNAITVVEDTVANAPRDVGFTFCPTDAGPCTSFTLDDDTDATLSNYRTFSALTPGRYTVTQDAVDDWVVTTISCDTGESIDLGARRATVELASGDQTVCTFQNRTPSVAIVHDATPDSGINVTYTFCSVATSVCSTAILDDDTNATRSNTGRFGDLPPGAYTATMTATNGQTLRAITCSNGETVDLANRRATITLAVGEYSNCTFAVSVP